MTEHLDSPVSEDGQIAANEKDYPKLADVTLIASLVDENLSQLD